MNKTKTYRDLVIEGFQTCIIWQDGGLDEYTISNLSDQLNSDIRDLVDSFVNILDVAEIVTLIEDASQFGHWLCLEQMGHGSGFYDSTDKTVSNISSKIEKANLHRPGHLYDDEGVLYSEFFKYGTS